MTAKKKKLPEGVRQLPNGRYQARYPVTTNGVTKQVSAGTFATISDAKDARSVEMVNHRTGRGWIDPKDRKRTVAEWSAEWAELRRDRLSRRPASFLRCHIVPTFGDVLLGDLTPIAVQRFVNDLSDRGLAPGTVRAIYALLRQVMAKAVDYDLLTKTPCRNIELPEVRRKERVPLSVEQLVWLEQNIEVRFAAMVHLAAWAGLRWQECAALRWENVDLEAGTLYICEAVKERDSKVGETKNRKTRVVDIGPATVAVLRGHRRDYGTTGLLFTGSRDGRLLDYHSFRHHTWAPLARRSGIEPAPTFHKLRHAFVGHMVRQGVDYVVLSEMVGHHSPSFTADNYGWKRPDHRAVTLAAVEQAMSGE